MRDHGGSIVNTQLLARILFKHTTLGNNASNGPSGAAGGIQNMTITLGQEWIESDVRIKCIQRGLAVWTEFEGIAFHFLPLTIEHN
eukprot:scaffold147684_cov83-Cyclotella_meneghiniana.AAC.1